MTNELIFIVTALVELSFVVFMLRFGKEALFGLIVANIIMVSTFGSQLITVFGMVTNAGNVYYASIFVCANILTEHYGRKAGIRSIWIGFGSLVLFVLMSQFVLRQSSVPETTQLSAAIKTIFGGVPRVAFASITAFLIAQNLNVWLFDWLHQKQGKPRLWLRNIISSFSGQIVDSVLFFSIAFLGTIPTPILIQTIFIGFVLKAVIAVASTPFLYLSYPMREQKDVGQI